ncbi:hypothetical protein AVW15_04735 [Chelatococcus daeguensis]|nr:hypothetical protein AVW15_04735 [Chelatococcus daeguensis]
MGLKRIVACMDNVIMCNYTLFLRIETLPNNALYRLNCTAFQMPEEPFTDSNFARIPILHE